jgi:CheY-like chemotaxis protein
MPIMDGLEAAQRIHERPELSHIPIIAVTAYDTYGRKEAAEEAGCDAYIAKPIDLDEFLEVVHAVENFWLTIVQLPRAR